MCVTFVPEIHFIQDLNAEFTVHTQTMKILLYTKNLSLSEARRLGSFFKIISHRFITQEAPSGAAAFIVSEGESGNNSRIISE